MTDVHRRRSERGGISVSQRGPARNDVLCGVCQCWRWLTCRVWVERGGKLGRKFQIPMEFKCTKGMTCMGQSLTYPRASVAWPEERCVGRKGEQVQKLQDCPVLGANERLKPAASSATNMNAIYYDYNDQNTSIRHIYPPHSLSKKMSRHKNGIKARLPSAQNVRLAQQMPTHAD